MGHGNSPDRNAVLALCCLLWPATLFRDNQAAVVIGNGAAWKK
ncbi:hypothetical protein GJA_1261 [Janthinobacterium agaricidamnosum NBRC 102515 = DSM 9628]|uniref:Uncharacterized protein n=1 Tax=Janthinobacterium agaricidamnosum NBRC 102515 = DSM 9628 TaxID=1349767 RepID=W0UZB6_9BURK|nr:hypothetical protein GJA_1261 [Janthinobacterium agaricidamnosum NBRC 102515 = DSM 9628]